MAWIMSQGKIFMGSGAVRTSSCETGLSRMGALSRGGRGSEWRYSEHYVIDWERAFITPCHCSFGAHAT